MKKVCSVFLAAMLLLSASVGALAVEIPIEGDFVIATEDESCYTIVDNVITFLDGAEVTLSGDGSNYVLVVADGAEVTITLNGFTCSRAGTWSSAVTLEGSASATIVLADGTVNNITGGQECSAIRVPQDASLTIIGSGTLNASVSNSGSMAFSAVIGSQYAQSYGNISILGGTIHMSISGSSQAKKASLGTTRWLGAEGTDNGTIIIANATVSCDVIGGANTSQYSSVVIVNSTVSGTVNASTIRDGASGWTVNGNFNLTSDFEIPAGQTLTIPNGSSLTVVPYAVLTNNGTIVNEEGGVLTVLVGTDLGTLVNDGQIIYITTQERSAQVQYSVAPTYTVTIPETVALGETVTLSAEDVIVEKGRQVEVALSATSGTDNAFQVKTPEGAELSYTVKNGETEVAVGDTVLTVDPETSSQGSVTLSFTVPSNIIYAGEYSGTVIFTVSVQDKP